MNIHDDGGLLWPGTYERAAAMAVRQAMPRKAGVLRRLHHGAQLLVLPNVWDADSARAVATAGFFAMATTSAGVVGTLGYADDDSAPPDDVFAVSAEIASAVDVPVTVDVEGGYGLTPEELAARVIGAGAVGLNLEDTDHRGGGLRDAAEQAARIAAVKRAGRSVGVDLVLNARVDVHIAQIGDAGTRLDESISRAQQYVAAGADCVYPILLEDEADLGAFVRAVRAPVNALLRPDGPSLETLQALGVRRVSTGPALWRAGAAALDDGLAALVAAAAALP